MTSPTPRRQRRLRVALLAGVLTLAGLGVGAAPSSAAPATAPPDNASPPSLTRSGRTLTTTNGDWNGPCGFLNLFDCTPDPGGYIYRWQRCVGDTCTTVNGAEGKTYLLTGPDIGRRVRSQVTARNDQGAATVASAPSAVITAQPASLVARPSISGTPEVGRTLTGTNGRWSDPQITRRHQWLRCASASTPSSSCTVIAGATGLSYALTSADDGRFVRLGEVADGLGSAFAASLTLGPVARPGSGTTPQPATPTNPPAPAPKPRKPRRLRATVVVAGRVSRSLTLITAFVVERATKGSRVSIICRGRGCPRGTTRKTLTRGRYRFRRLQRMYGRGTRFEVRVTKRGMIGKYTKITLRRGLPSRRDACLKPGARRPSRCPL